ncbi:MAG: glucose 1-dehydrogenase [Anaerolineae bacterium]|nr:glucose 1-dehydrogenase [Anaerolineae bacterium]
MSNLVDLQGKVALVTGAGSGIGRGIALRLAEAGAQVAIGYVGEADGANATLAMLPAPENAMIVAADIRVQAEVQQMVGQVVERFGRLDVMVCNAGFYHEAPLLEAKEADWRAVLDTNVTGTFFCVQAAARAMIQTSGGRIVIIGSTQAHRPLNGPLAYAVSKGALVTMTRALALELAPHGISVAIVSPGVMEAAGNIAHLADLDRRRAVEAQIPIQRVGQPRDIGAVVAFLACDAASYITGVDIVVDGGLLTYGPQI